MTVPFPTLRRRLVAILRGVKPDETLAIGAAVFEAGIEAIEVPLNSPDPFRSIEMLASSLPKSALVGAGTVLTAGQVDSLHRAGGRLLVSPNIDRSVMERAVHHGMVTMPGVFTPTEAFLALSLGASALKFFPASALGAKGIAAIMAVLPKETIAGAVGGVSEKDFGDYAKIGVSTFGLGSSLYAPGLSVEAVAGRAIAAVAAWDAVFATGAS
ncbi:2-dehydro-3-deoxy-6-phosphogalactonate aldolase [Mesorhizobium sp. KR9-304]|uniref:2-dehydro-3-deoxy-6-phosphogalactonate aldolase n=1 Tax=Mesorhizobium sp. KR9-304 TaxID=3156614 RepID=UPI0032B4021D